MTFKKQKYADLEIEKEIWSKNYLIVGVDEVGRGALSGPIGFGFVCLNNHYKVNELQALLDLGIRDSKQLSTLNREKLLPDIEKYICACKTSYADVHAINKVGLIKASESAIRQGIESIKKDLHTKLPIFILLDAFHVKYIKGVGLKNQLAIIKGDEKSISIASASIIAKVHRDALMKQLAKDFPQYFWDINKGYGTQQHREAIKKYGPTKHHRKLFIRKILGEKI